MLKRCSKCRIEKPVEEFHKNRSAKDGYNNQCKACRAIIKKQWYANHKEEQKLERIKNKTYHTEYKKKWYLKNKEQHNIKSKEYYKNHKKEAYLCFVAYLKSQPAAVYKITSPNGVVYIGSSRHIYHRFNGHRLNLKNHIHGNPTLNKLSYLYNPDDFKFKIFTIVDKKQTNYKKILLHLEQQMINAHPGCCNVRPALPHK